MYHLEQSYDTGGSVSRANTPSSLFPKLEPHRLSFVNEGDNCTTENRIKSNSVSSNQAAVLKIPLVGLRREGIYAHIQMIHKLGQQKLTQPLEAIMLQLNHHHHQKK